MTKSKPTSLSCSLHSTTEVCRLLVDHRSTDPRQKKRASHLSWSIYQPRPVRLIRDRCERLSQPPNVSSAAPRVPAPASPRLTPERHRNKQAPMLAAGANSPALARLAAARQRDRRSDAGM